MQSHFKSISIHVTTYNLGILGILGLVLPLREQTCAKQLKLCNMRALCAMCAMPSSRLQCVECPDYMVWSELITECGRG